jgi:hypothetical protein
LAALALVVAGCATRGQHAPEPLNPAAVEPAAKASRYVSPRFDYEWRIPAGWEQVSPSSIELGDAPKGFEIVAVQARGGPARSSVIIAVTDELTANPAVSGDGADLEREATKWFLFHGVSRSGSAQTKVIGLDALRVDGQIPLPMRFVSATLFVKDRRRFELRCIAEQSPPEPTCRDVLAGLELHDSKPEAPDQGRVLHLRDAPHAVSFDAPAAGSWMAHDPRSARARDAMWIWTSGDRRIDLTVVQSASTSKAALEETIKAISDGFTKRGASVDRTEAELAGRPCAHLVVEEARGLHRDLFVEGRGDFTYVVAIIAPTRDAGLVEQARAALRIEPPAPPPP